MSRSVRCVAAIAALLALAPPFLRDLRAQAHSPLGTNMGRIQDYNSDFPFLDFFKTSRPWISNSTNRVADARAIDVDAHGWVRSLQANQIATTLLFWDLSQSPGAYPSGRYIVTYEGQGTLAYGGSAVRVETAPGRDVIDVDPARGGGIRIDLTSVNTANYMRNIQVRQATASTTEVFNPVFLARTQPYRVLRFKDWMATDGDFRPNGPQTDRSWSDRPTVEDARWSENNGVPLEIMVALANRLNVDAWFNMPHMADDDYVRQFAQNVQRLLKPNLKVYIEYSNEVWNGGYAQAYYAREQGLALGLSTNAAEAQTRFHSRRSREVFGIFEQVFPKERLVRVLGSFHGNRAVSQTALAYGDTAAHTDALAVAPYFGIQQADLGTVTGMSLDALMERVRTASLAEARTLTQQQVEVARAYGIPVIGYEGGQSLVATGTYMADTALNALFDAANRDPRMGTIYDRFLQDWTTDTGGGLLMHFTDCGRYGVYGRFGSVEYMDQPRSQAPKFDALMRWMGVSDTPAPVLPSMALDRTSLFFGAVSGTAGFSARTPSQTIRLTQAGTGTVSWTAASNQSWLTVSPASGSGPAILTVSVQASSGLAASQAGSVTLTFTGAANASAAAGVTLRVGASADPVSLPFGIVDTPAGDATVLAGSIAIGGWTLDNVAVQRVEIWRDLQAGETTPAYAGPAGDPRNGKVFIGNASFVDGARPDIETLNPATPISYRAGWGYLLLTWGLANQGNGTYRLTAVAVDQENNVASIGAKTIVVSNNAAARPFGSIDTPAIGGEASGPNFGWALTPRVNGAATCTIPATGVQVSIDSGPLQPVVFGDARTDIAGAFPGFSNTAAAGGHFIFDWSTLSPGAHTIGWLITDSCNRADGVGSRFFTVSGATSLVASSDGFRLKAETSSAADFRLKAETTERGGVDSALDPVVSAFRRNRAEEKVSALRRNDSALLLARGYGELPEIVPANDGGTYTVEMKQGERIELRLPRSFATVYQIGPGGGRRAIPAGATWDSANGIFYWQPAPGFLGRYRLVFGSGAERMPVRIVIEP